MNSKYMMGTTAIHGMGDISRAEPDLCVVDHEEGDNYIGNWVCGFGFVSVKFPKATTRDLTPDEIEKYHGMAVGVGDMISFLNLKNEKFVKSVVLYKEGAAVFSGKLMCPPKVGKFLYVIDPNSGRHYRTSNIVSIDNNVVKTHNSTYEIQYES